MFTIKIYSVVLMILFLTVSCVSSKKYNARLDDINNLNTTIASLQKEIDETTSRNYQLERSLQELRGEHDELTDSHRKLTDLNANLNFLLEAKRDELTKTAADLQYKLASTEETLAKKEHELDELQQTNKAALKTKELEIANLTHTYNNLVDELKDEIKEGQIEVTQLRDKLSLSLVEKVLFDSGSAMIKTNGKKVLTRVAEILHNVTDKQVRIEGHTDNVPIGPKIIDQFPSNWELSTTRATNVVKFLIEQGLDPQLVSASGYSEYRPVASNDTDEGRSRNRRIEIVLIPLDIDRVIQPNPVNNTVSP